MSLERRFKESKYWLLSRCLKVSIPLMIIFPISIAVAVGEMWVDIIAGVLCLVVLSPWVMTWVYWDPEWTTWEEWRDEMHKTKNYLVAISNISSRKYDALISDLDAIANLPTAAAEPISLSDLPTP